MPVDEVPETCENKQVRVVAFGAMGWRNGMEDAHITNLDLGDGNMLFAVFDGHLGDEVALYVKENFCDVLLKRQAYKDKDYRKALIETFFELDKMIDEVKVQILKKINFPGQAETVAGCTATVLLVTPTELICANAGDSRTVLSSKKTAIEMSHDHKPDHAKEKERIEKAGGYVDNGRVNGNLAVSRAIGDLFFKRTENVSQPEMAVSAMPDFEVRKRDKQSDEFIVLACDGIWDCKSSQEFVDIVHNVIYKDDFE